MHAIWLLANSILTRKRTCGIVVHWHVHVLAFIRLCFGKALIGLKIPTDSKWTYFVDLAVQGQNVPGMGQIYQRNLDRQKVSRLVG